MSTTHVSYVILVKHVIPLASIATTVILSATPAITVTVHVMWVATGVPFVSNAITVTTNVTSATRSVIWHVIMETLPVMHASGATHNATNVTNVSTIKGGKPYGMYRLSVLLFHL